MELVKVALWSVACLLVSTSLGCASSPQESSEAETPATQTSEAFEIIALEYADGSPPELPEGCKIDKTTSTTMLQCKDSYVLLSAPLLGDGQEATESVLDDQKQDWINAGWSVQEDGAQKLEVDGTGVELTRYKLTQAQRQSAYLGGVIDIAQLDDPRFAICAPNYGRNFDAARCRELLNRLTDYVTATRVTGVLLNGEPIEFGDDCVVREGTVRCDKTVLEWVKLDSETGTKPPAPEDVAKTMRDRGVEVDMSSVACTLADEPGECMVLEFSAPSYPDQAVVFMDAARGAQTLRVTCDILEPADPIALPEPCNAVMDVDFRKGGND